MWDDHRKADAEPDVDTLREGVRVMTQALMELEVAQHLGAERYQRSPDRQGGLQARRLSGDAA
jgi:transposase-like protein